MRVSPKAKVPPFSPGERRYRGPADGRSQPAKPPVKTLASAALKLAYRKELEGQENLPTDGAHVFAPNHPGYLDPLILTDVVDHDLRFMAAIENFQTAPGARINSWAGAFPVDRKSPHPATMQHGSELIKEGASLGIFPEGRPPEEIGRLGPIKAGAALFALEGDADSVVPIALHYTEGRSATPKEKRRGRLKAAGLAGLAAAGALLGGPLGLAGAALAGGALFGSAAGHGVARKAVKNPDVRTPFPKMIAGALGGAVGAIAGGAVGMALVGAAPAVAVGALAAGAVGVGSAAWSKLGAERDVVQVRVGEPIPVEPYRQRPDRKEAVAELSEQLHRSIGGELELLSGLPYDDSTPKLR